MVKFIIAIMLALLYLTFLGRVAETTESERGKHKNEEWLSLVVLFISVFRVSFYGTVLNSLLTLMHLMDFNLSNIFLCSTLVIFYECISSKGTI